MISEEATLAVIIPCFNSPNHIKNTCTEILTYFNQPLIVNGLNIKLSRIVLVDDGANFETKVALQDLKLDPKVTLITLHKNYGQHPAIFAGVLNTTEDYLVTMDEDGEHNPNDLQLMFEEYFNKSRDIVYANFKLNQNFVRESLSKLSKSIITWISGDRNVKYFSSYRLVSGEVFRNAAIYANNGSFLDVALSWITKNIGHIETFKRKTNRTSTYSLRGLFTHFGKLFFASGIRPLIFLFNFGWIISLLSLITMGFIIYRRIFNYVPVQGWVSNTVILIFFGGIIISSLGLIARYISSIVETSSGKPYFSIKNNSDV